jgi:PAS domain S-box-containing protein
MEMTGYSEQELIGKSSRVLYESDEEFERVMKIKYDQIRIRKIGSVETRWRRQDGSVIDVFLQARAFSIEQPTRAIFSALDITQRKRAEKELRDLKNELEQRVRDRTSQISEINKQLQSEILNRKLNEDHLQKTNKKLKELTSELALVEEHERRRLATEIHDQIGQKLAVSLLRLDFMAERISDAPLKRLWEDAHKFVKESIHEVRNIIKQLSPPVLYELGFVHSIEWLAENMTETHGIPVYLKNEPLAVEPDLKTKLILFQAVRELVMNSIKHARAGHITISIKTDEGKISITVEDDGIGFDLESAFSGKGFGLMSVRERLQNMGGLFEIDSTEQGTRAKITANP